MIMDDTATAPLHRRSRISTGIDFSRDGAQHGFLSVPLSTHRSAYGRIQIPIACLKNGVGPSVLLMAGNHGDEYEGQIALTRLVQEIDVSSLSGRLIILPAANLPAVEAGQRTSPIDDGNLNRAFPGDPDGGPTAMIAHYIESVLLPMADYAIDLHSGGSSLIYLPCALVRDNGSAEHVDATFALLDAFGGSLAYISDGRNQGAERTFHSAADRCGVVILTTELGGGGGVDRAALALAEAGLRRVLRHVRVWAGATEATTGAVRTMKVDGAAAYVLAPEAGLFEPRVELGASVAAGELAGYIHFPDTPWKASVPVPFQIAGLVICKRATSATRRGDCLFQVVSDYHRPRLRA